jgi:hypothetical protein
LVVRVWRVGAQFLAALEGSGVVLDAGGLQEQTRATASAVLQLFGLKASSAYRDVMSSALRKFDRSAKAVKAYQSLVLWTQLAERLLKEDLCQPVISDHYFPSTFCCVLKFGL